MNDEYEIERLMADYEFPADETDGDKLEAMKDELSDNEVFRKWFKKHASPNFRNLSGVGNFIDFIAQLPPEERNGIKDMLEDRILGNPTLEVSFMLRYGMPFALSEFYDGMKVMSDELNEINRSINDEAVRNIMLLRDEQRNYATLVSRASQVSLKEIEEAGRRQIVEIYEQKNVHQRELEAYSKKAQAEIEIIRQQFEKEVATRRLNIEAEIEAEKTKARNTVYKDISSKIESVADKAFKKVNDKYSFRNALYNAGAVMIGMAAFTILGKFFH